ncbi:MAG: NUDIX domain-containing protein [Thermoplasmata archaeon]|nr:NUDIX domain-containing protein [Thermoplasmata archaeon]
MAAGPPVPEPPRPDEPIARECVEGYLYSAPPVRVLVFRRPANRGSIWVPVSGKVDPGDPTLLAALGRELEEETGLRAPRDVFSLDWEVPFRAPNGEVWRLHAFAVEVVPNFEPRLSAEHDAWEWVRPDEALRRLHYEDNREAVRRLLDRLGPRARNA